MLATRRQPNGTCCQARPTATDSPSTTGRDRTTITNRGDHARTAILTALRELLDRNPITDVSVQAITRQAGVTRTAFYFYFESKYSALAELLHGRTTAAMLDKSFALRTPGESTPALVARVIAGIRAALAADDPVWASCRASSGYEPEIAEIVAAVEDAITRRIVEIVSAEVHQGAQPISTDLPALVRVLTTATVAGSAPAGVGAQSAHLDRTIDAVSALWRNALWPR
ncbi:TetR/AcrR family transcriptional regulator [Mycolicibacterium sp. 141076]|uniref:TetR/AcrR family transcriptional regulator n=1 Tax=Mycolicibacterium sp. 141076 TaxID=3090599 RepID=UPI00299E3E64|nr:TetR/AcrR family transcriptional regulator [Mycolicibacterium sp. 141076]MDX1876632.1 TetR/AcrR family transcriptional regulator [Mycolicibacterium sp. 141076]